MAAMKGNLIRMSGVRDALELGLIYPCSTPTMDMVSDLNTKACSALQGPRTTCTSADGTLCLDSFQQGGQGHQAGRVQTVHLSRPHVHILRLGDALAGSVQFVRHHHPRLSASILVYELRS